MGDAIPTRCTPARTEDRDPDNQVGAAKDECAGSVCEVGEVEKKCGQRPG